MSEDKSKYRVSNNFKIKKPQAYVFDFDKINDINDLKNVLKGLNVVVYDTTSMFDELKPYLKRYDD